MGSLFGGEKRGRRRCRIDRASHGSYFLNLHENEAKVLYLFAQLLKDEMEDTENKRLYPEAHPNNSAFQDEFDSLTQQDLVASRSQALAAFAEPPSREPLSADELSAWLNSVNILHLGLGAKLEACGIDLSDISMESIDDEEGRFQVAAYLLMTDIIEEVSHSLISARRGESRDSIDRYESD